MCQEWQTSEPKFGLGIFSMGSIEVLYNYSSGSYGQISKKGSIESFY